MLEGFEPRLYQQTILNTCVHQNTMAVLPTGLGKTAIGMMLAAHRLEEYPDSKVVFLAPTKPLVQQHMRTFTEYFDIDEDKLEIFTGDIRPDKREELWVEKKIIFSTPQGFENDVISNRVKLEEVSLMIFDECHKATGDYSYVFIAHQYTKKAKDPLILGLTASPGANKAKIREVCDNLFIDEIELRTEEDPDVKPYIQDVDVERIEVELTDDFRKVIDYLKKCYNSKLNQIKHFGYLSGKPSNYSRKSLLQVQRGLQAKLAKGDKSFEILKSLSLLAEAMKVQHALILAETQGVDALLGYMNKLNKQAQNTKTKAVKNLVKDTNFKAARAKADLLKQEGIDHPKLKELKKQVAKVLNQRKDAKIIIFNQYRDQVKKIKKELDRIGMKSEVFVGQAKKGGLGMSQKEQKEAIKKFEEGEFNCLLATSVAEEGLDIPAVDLVIFYEPVPSAIRTVQRRGRTGRQEKGKVVVLITKGTIDEAYKWSAYHREKKMIKAIRDIKGNFEPDHEGPKLTEYVEEEEQPTVYADYREKGSGVIKELSLSGVDVKLKTLEVGDYLLSEDVCVEFKTVKDFADSVIDGRLLDQLKSLRKYKKPLVIIQGKENIYSQRKISPNAIRGMLSTIMLSYNISLYQTNDAQDTAAFLKYIARKEQEGKKADFQFHTAKPLTLGERQEYIVAAIPGIGNKLAKPLLEEFGSIKAIVNASAEELKRVDLIGKKKAEQIREVLDEEYDQGE